MLRHAWLLILCLFALSLVTTAILHAQESYGVAEISCGGVVHAEGDADQVPADRDMPVPHHHGACHGHNLTAEVATSVLAPSLAMREAPAPARVERLERRTVDPALRPPEA